VIGDYVPDIDKSGKIQGFFALVTDITERKRTEEALQKSEKKYRNLIESLQEGIWVIDRDAKTVFVNSPMADMLGYTIDEMAGRHLFEFMDEKAVVVAKENLLRQEAGMAEQLDFEFLRKDGSRVNTILAARPLADDNGNYDGSIAGIIDVTERREVEKALEASEERYRSLVESSEDSIYLVDGECRYLYMNKKHLERFNLQPERIIGRPYDQFHSEKKTQEFRKGVSSVLKKGESHRYVHESERGDGYYLRTLSPVKDRNGKTKAVTVVSKDITEIIEAEEELRQANKNLAKEHYERKLLSDRLIDLQEKDRKWTAMELHDHVGQILTSLKLDIEIIDKKLNPEDGELGARITVAKERTIQAIKAVKDVAQGLSPGMLGTLGLVPCLHDLFNEVRGHTDIQVRFFSRNVPDRFAPEKELAIYRIVQEAISNTVRHAQAKTIFVNIIKKDQKLILTVEDDGVGFDQEKVMAGTSAEMPMGLLIMRERAEKLGGLFRLDTEVGKGTHLMVEMAV